MRGIKEFSRTLEAELLPAQVFSSDDRLRRGNQPLSKKPPNEQSLRFSLSRLISRLLSPRCSGLSRGVKASSAADSSKLRSSSSPTHVSSHGCARE